MSLDYNDSQRFVFSNNNNNNSSDPSGMDSLDKFFSLKLNERNESKYFFNSQLNANRVVIKTQQQQLKGQQTEKQFPMLTSQPKSFQQIDQYKLNVMENPLFMSEKIEANFKQNEFIRLVF